MFAALPNATMVGYNGVSTVGPSQAIWSRMVTGMSAPEGSPGFVVGDDFLTGAGVLATSAVTIPTADVMAYSPYYAYLDSGTSLSRVSAQGGVLRLACTTSDNDMVAIHSGLFGEISRTAGESVLTCFETRLRLPTQVSVGSVAVGLGALEIVADGGLVANSGEIINTGGGFIGFRSVDATPSVLDFGYKISGQAALTETVDAAHTAVADTFVKLGFVYDPQAPASKRITAYVNGAEVTSAYVTDTAMAAATFPNSVMMGIVIAAKTDASTERLLDIDWVYAGQVRQ